VGNNVTCKTPRNTNNNVSGSISFLDLLSSVFSVFGSLFFPSLGDRSGSCGRSAGDRRRTDRGSVGAAVSGCYWRLRFSLGELADWRWRRSVTAVVGYVGGDLWGPGGCGWPGEGDRGWGRDGSSWRTAEAAAVFSLEMKGAVAGRVVFDRGQGGHDWPLVLGDRGGWRAGEVGLAARDRWQGDGGLNQKRELAGWLWLRVGRCFREGE